MELILCGIEFEKPTLSEKAEKGWQYYGFEKEGTCFYGSFTRGWRAVHLPSGQWLTMDEAGSWESLAVWDTEAELNEWLEEVADEENRQESLACL